MTERELKTRFAKAWLKNPNDPFGAVVVATNGNTLAACQLVNVLSQDPEVHAIKEQLLEEFGEAAFLPTESELLHDILHRARNCTNDDDYTKLIRLVADIRGMIQKPGVTINNTVTTNKVMVIPSRATEKDWEKGLLEQQRGLLTNG